MTKGEPPQKTCRLAAFAMAIALCSSPAVSQSLDCNALRAQIAATPVQTNSRAIAAAQRQRAELQRTAAYAEQIGCNRRQFLFFGSQPPPQCGQIEARMATMRGNLDRLQNAVDRGSAQRDNLLARYNQLCTRQANGPRTFFDQLFNGGGTDPEDLVTDDFQQPEEMGPRRGSKAVCVRTCDGYFFPVSFNASGQSPDRLFDICRAQCPAAETQVFTYSPSRDITDAVSISGEPYTSLTNALKYRRTFDPACTCRPAGKGWAETLAPAERLLSSSRQDLIVTPEKAEELSRPRQPSPSRTEPANGRQPAAQTIAPRASATSESDRLADTGNRQPEDVRRVRRVGPAL
ncbi:MAG: DUF2865 domain-containing protein [Beijerinckiaceae bacterium]|nr:DUF2865 domain-containing protein [Beijerinckiaceae bacterium]